jgi:hypothetical protein
VLASRSSFVGPDSEFMLDFLKGVSGGTASGKTTVCDMIIQQLHDHRVVLVNQVCVLTAASVTAAGLFWFENVLLLLLLSPVKPGSVLPWFCIVYSRYAVRTGRSEM